MGYERVKEKVKDVRQEYRKAVTEGRRSGSRKLIADSWDLLKKSKRSTRCQLYWECCSSVNGDNIEEVADQDETDDDSEQSRERQKTSLSIEGNQRAGPSKIAQYVDNKRKQMEKNISANQRDKLYLDMAQDERDLQENTGKALWKPQISPIKLLKQFQSQLKKLESHLETVLLYWLMQCLEPTATNVQCIDPRQL